MQRNSKICIVGCWYLYIQSEYVLRSASGTLVNMQYACTYLCMYVLNLFIYEGVYAYMDLYAVCVRVIFGHVCERKLYHKLLPGEFYITTHMPSLNSLTYLILYCKHEFKICLK